MKKLSLWVLILTFLVTTLSGCSATSSKANQFTNSLVELIMFPFNMADLNQKEYSNDLSGNIQKLSNERSSQNELILSIEDYSGLEDLGVDQYLQGARLTFNSDYDIKTGDGLFEFNGLGLVNGSMALHEGALAIDLSQFLDNLIIYNFESGLNFSKDIRFIDRMDDLVKAINPETLNSSDMIAEMQTYLDKYAGIAATQIKASSIKSEKTELSIMGKDTKVGKETITLTNDDLKNITKAILEVAVADDELASFLYKLSSQQAYSAYDSEEEYIKEFQDSIQDSLDDLDDSFDDTDYKVELGIYYSYSGLFSKVINGLPFQKKTPVAIDVNYMDDDSNTNIFYKYIQDGRAIDFKITIADEYETLNVDLSNIKDGDQYILNGNLSVPYDTLALNISGTTTISSASEIGDYEFVMTLPDSAFDKITMSIDSELSEIKKGSSYKAKGTLDLKMDGYQAIGITLGIKGTYEFSDSVDVDLPDFNDPDAQVYDDFQALIEDLAMYY